MYVSFFKKQIIFRHIAASADDSHIMIGNILLNRQFNHKRHTYDGISANEQM